MWLFCVLRVVVDFIMKTRTALVAVDTLPRSSTFVYIVHSPVRVYIYVCLYNLHLG